MNAEEIVRKLAETNEPAYVDTNSIRCCDMCNGDDRHGKPYNVIHDSDCPWSQARKWVKENFEFQSDCQNIRR